MNPIEVLHNAVRHYCIDEAATWRQRYAELSAAGRDRTTIRAGNWDHTGEAYDIIPRYQVLAAIQSEVEQFVPEDFTSAEEARTMLIAAGETAQSPYKFEKPIEIQAVESERQRFVDFIRFADERQLVSLPMLPFRRVLGSTEHSDLHAVFIRRWGKWYGG